MDTSIYSESVKSKKDGEDYTMTAKIVPFGKISRNNVMYDKESVCNTHTKLVGKPVLYNHKVDGGLPRGEWVSTEIKEDGMYGTAKIYNTDYNKDLIEYLSHASSPTVSLEVVGDAEKKISEQTGKQYGLAKVRDWLEASIVNVPGFEEAKISNFECYIAESLGLGIQSIDNNGGIPVSEFKEIFEKLDKHEALMEKIVGYLEKFDAKKADEKEDDKKEVEVKEKFEDKKEDDKKEDKKEEVKAEAVAEVKAEAKAEEKEDKKEEACVQKEEVRTVDERDNSEDAKKKDDEEKAKKAAEPVKKESVEEVKVEAAEVKTEAVEVKAEVAEVAAEVKTEAKAEDKKEDEKSDLPKGPETVKESAKIVKMNESFSASKSDLVWNEMLKRHFGN